MKKQQPKQAVAPKNEPPKTPLSRILWLSNDARLSRGNELSDTILYWVARSEKAEKKLADTKKILSYEKSWNQSLTNLNR